jgi:hypothetical protein
MKDEMMTAMAVLPSGVALSSFCFPLFAFPRPRNLP